MPNSTDDTAQIVIVGFPTGFHFGLDLFMWTVGDKFRGVSKIPPGIHFVYFSAPGDEFRQGFFLDLAPNEILVRKWDIASETLVVFGDSTEENSFKLAAMRDFQFMAGIAPFFRCMDAGLVSEWRAGSSFVSSELVSTIQPLNGGCFKSTFLGGPSDGVFWSEIPKLHLPNGLSLSEISKRHLDKTDHLIYVMAKHFPNSSDQVSCILGELQTSFILFLLGQNYAAFLQWRALLELFLGCAEEGVKQYSFLFSEFLTVLLFQIRQLPSDSILGEDTNELFLLPLLSIFLSVCFDESLSTEFGLIDGANLVEAAMVQKFGAKWKKIV